MPIQDFLRKLVAPKGSVRAGGRGATPSFAQASQSGDVPAPSLTDHLTDLTTSRLSDNVTDLTQFLATNDPDMSAALNGYLTLADTEPVVVVRDFDGQIDPDATKIVYDLMRLLGTRVDYTLKFSIKPGLRAICESLRWMLLVRGGLAVEAVVGKQLEPREIRIVDPKDITWNESKLGDPKPTQVVSGLPDIDLNLPNVFFSYHRRDPTTLYPRSFFVSSVNTIAARQQVINDLYRVFRLTGYPRIAISVVEEVLQKNAPVDIARDAVKLREWKRAFMAQIGVEFAALRADQAFIHSDAVEPGMVNEKNPAAQLDLSKVVDTLNDQNQAALKTMGTIIGRGESGVNTASVEARIAAMNADELNNPISYILESCFNFWLHLEGIQGYCEVKFKKVELRPEMELEPQITMKASRMLQDLSLGIITDNEYALQMHGRLPPDGYTELSGTGFMPVAGASVDASGVSPNSDPLGRSVASEGSQ